MFIKRNREMQVTKRPNPIDRKYAMARRKNKHMCKRTLKNGWRAQVGSARVLPFYTRWSLQNNHADVLCDMICVAYFIPGFFVGMMNDVVRIFWYPRYVQQHKNGLDLNGIKVLEGKVSLFLFVVPFGWCSMLLHFRWMYPQDGHIFIWMV